MIFEAELEALALPPGVSNADAEFRANVMHSDEGALISWSWRKLQIDSSSRMIVIRERRPYVSVFDGIQDITSFLLGNEDIDSNGLSAAIIDHFKSSSMTA